MPLTKKAERTREGILAAGEDLVRSKGFVAVGLQEILSTSGVPKGSFYHYFSSKENFGVAVLERYIARYLAAVDTMLAPGAEEARPRIRRLAEAWAAQAGDASAECCLVVKLSAEVSSSSEPMRTVLARGVSDFTARLATAIEDGYVDGSLPERRPAAELAEALYQLWLGAALLDRLGAEGEPLHAMLRTTDALIS